MSIASRLPALAVTAVVVAGLGLMAWKFVGGDGSSARVDVKVPALSAMARKGEASYDENCAACHGANAGGSDQGPPLVHKIYNPGHHADAAFFIAAQRGVRGHHWPFGDMPAQPQVDQRQISDIIRFVRELQIANGITYKRHNM